MRPSLTTIVVAASQIAIVYSKPLAFPQDPNISTTVTPEVTATSPSTPAPSTNTPTYGNPCAQISQLIYGNATAAGGNVAPASFTALTPRVPAQLALDCLNDVPLDATSAKPWLRSLRPYIEWQSTTAYLRDPPEGYLEPAYDIWAEFEDIVSGIDTGRYANEYELEFDIYQFFQASHDGHFRYIPNLVGAVFGFGRPISLVSYSLDGTDIPKPYVYTDVLSMFVNGTAAPSAIIEIDGQDAVEFLENWAQFGSLNDPDALYNNVFYELAQVSLGSSGAGAGTFAGAGRGQYIFPGATTTLKFENGTSATFDNFARVLASFNNIKSGTDLYRIHINPYLNVASPTVHINVASSAIPTNSARPGYPTDPVKLNPYNYIGGYYLDEPGYEDVAVLTVTSFVGTADYQEVAYSFLDQASKDGKTKLVIDVSANGGGTIIQGYNLFLNLFPDIMPYGASRFRSHEAFDIIGETVSERMFYYPFDYDNPPNWTWQDFAGGVPFNYRADVDADGKDFGSWRDKNPPTEFMGDNFTSIIRWNLSDPTIPPANEVTPNGYGDRAGLPSSRPFEPENIVILYDGYCASTCAIFSEFMVEQVGIKTISIGGRPREEPMQTVGGVKGTNVYPWAFIYKLVNDVYTLAPDQAGYFNSSALYPYMDPEITELPWFRGLSASGQVNVRDGIREGDESQTPLQFIYDPAECRIWYTADMTVDVTSIWEKTVDVTWGGDSCAVGGFAGRNKEKRDTGEAQKAKAKRRLRKRMQRMTAGSIKALKESLNVFTDLSSIVPQQGLMLP